MSVKRKVTVPVGSSLTKCPWILARSPTGGRAPQPHVPVRLSCSIAAKARSLPARFRRSSGHLLLRVGLRKSALRVVQFRHFDHAQRRLTVFTKGGKVQTVPVVDAFWNELERWILDWEAQPMPAGATAQKSFPPAFREIAASQSRYAPGRNRTCDLALRRRTLYPLSYRREGV